MKKQILLIIVSVFLVALLVSNVSAVDRVFKERSIVDIKVPCVNNNTLCSTSATCNITIYYPNGSSLISNDVMTNLTGFFNYTLNETKTTPVGNYPFDVFCIDGDYKGYSSLEYTISGSGFKSSDSSNRAVYFVLAIAALFFIGGIFTKKTVFRWSMFLLFTLFLCIGANITFISIYNDMGDTNIGAVFDKLAMGSTFLFWICSFLLLMLWIFSTIASLANRKHIKDAEAVGAPVDLQKW